MFDVVVLCDDAAAAAWYVVALLGSLAHGGRRRGFAEWGDAVLYSGDGREGVPGGGKQGGEVGWREAGWRGRVERQAV